MNLTVLQGSHDPLIRYGNDIKIFRTEYIWKFIHEGVMLPQVLQTLSKVDIWGEKKSRGQGRVQQILSVRLGPSSQVVIIYILWRLFVKDFFPCGLTYSRNITHCQIKFSDAGGMLPSFLAWLVRKEKRKFSVSPQWSRCMWPARSIRKADKD